MITTNLETKILREVNTLATKFGAEWLAESRITAPLGFTEKLKRGLVVTYKEGKGLSLSHEWAGGSAHQKQPFLHVPKKMVGYTAWFHYGYQYLINRNRQVDLTEKSKYWLYYLGLNWARKHGYPSYTWAYATEAYKRLGGIMNLRSALTTGKMKKSTENYNTLAGRYIPNIKSQTRVV